MNTFSRHIPESEIRVEYARSSGPGGQNVNKLNTKAQARWRVGESRVFTAEEKERLRFKLRNRLTSHDEIVVSAEAERTQLQNKTQAVAKLRQLVAQALRVPNKRRRTKPTLGSKERRLRTKAKRSDAKRQRTGGFSFEF